MKPSFLLLGLLALAACNNDQASTTAPAGKDSTTNNTAATPPVDSATAMKNWETYMTPGEPHKMMAGWDGSWTGEVSMWMSPEAPPQVSPSTMSSRMMLGGRYQMSEHKGDFSGMPLEGMSITAYDNAKKVFLSNWIDNMGTGILNLEGPWNESTKTIEFRGKMVDPSTGKEVNVRQDYHVVDADHHTLEMFYDGPDGKSFKTMEIRYTRK